MVAGANSKLEQMGVAIMQVNANASANAAANAAAELKQAEAAADALKQAEVKLVQQQMWNTARQKLQESNHASKLQVMKLNKEQVALAAVVHWHAM